MQLIIILATDLAKPLWFWVLICTRIALTNRNVLISVITLSAHCNHLITTAMWTDNPNRPLKEAEQAYTTEQGLCVWVMVCCSLKSMVFGQLPGSVDRLLALKEYHKTIIYVYTVYKHHYNKTGNKTSWTE